MDGGVFDDAAFANEGAAGFELWFDEGDEGRELRVGG